MKKISEKEREMFFEKEKKNGEKKKFGGLKFYFFQTIQFFFLFQLCLVVCDGLLVSLCLIVNKVWYDGPIWLRCPIFPLDPAGQRQVQPPKKNPGCSDYVKDVKK